MNPDNVEFIRAAQLWLQVIELVGLVLMAGWVYLDRRNDKTNERVVELAKQVEKLDKDVTALKASAEQAPNHGDLGEVYRTIKEMGENTNKSISDLSSTVHQLVGENRGQTDMLRTIFNRLTEKAMS